MIKLKRIIQESFNYYKNGNWIHYSDVDYLKTRTDTDSQSISTGDPPGIYLFPEESTKHFNRSILNYFSKKKNKIYVKVPSNINILDISKINTLLIKRLGINIGHIETKYFGKDITLPSAFWKYLKIYFKNLPDGFVNFFVSKGYDAVFDDVGAITGKDEVQLIVFNSSILDIIKIVPNDLKI